LEHFKNIIIFIGASLFTNAKFQKIWLKFTDTLETNSLSGHTILPYFRAISKFALIIWIFFLHFFAIFAILHADPNYLTKTLPYILNNTYLHIKNSSFCLTLPSTHWRVTTDPGNRFTFYLLLFHRKNSMFRILN